LLKEAITRSLATDATVFRFLDNNDTGARFITRYGLARTKVSAALLMTLPGIPELFTGDEVGAAFEPYKDTHPLTWNDEHALFPYYQRLIALRAAHADLRSRDLRFIDTGNAHVLGFRRKGPEQDDILVLLNFASAPASVRLAKARARFEDLLTGETLGARVQLPANGARILVPAVSGGSKKHRPAPHDGTR
jgi:glycosidase